MDRGRKNQLGYASPHFLRMLPKERASALPATQRRASQAGIGPKLHKERKVRHKAGAHANLPPFLHSLCNYREIVKLSFLPVSKGGNI